jgi:hypothetical protein
LEKIPSETEAPLKYEYEFGPKLKSTGESEKFLSLKIPLIYDPILVFSLRSNVSTTEQFGKIFCEKRFSTLSTSSKFSSSLKITTNPEPLTIEYEE